jgi:Fe-S-cluster containining protein
VACDRDLVQIVDAAMAEAVRKGGAWVVCKPGCIECCIGPFPITMLDAARLRAGLIELKEVDPARAARVVARAAAYLDRFPDYPGDLATGLLSDEPDAEERFATFGEEAPCPALDPEAGTCDLYSARPITCRMFGPAVRSGDGPVGVCELCYKGATEGQIAACEVRVDPGGLEDELLAGDTRQTIVAFALLQ